LDQDGAKAMLGGAHAAPAPASGEGVSGGGDHFEPVLNEGSSSSGASLVAASWLFGRFLGLFNLFTFLN
jgi:hypothetical protein